MEFIIAIETMIIIILVFVLYGFVSFANNHAESIEHYTKREETQKQQMAFLRRLLREKEYELLHFFRAGEEGIDCFSKVYDEYMKQKNSETAPIIFKNNK
jgi:hypothetical protein